jgi:hypothetical protein
MTPSPVVLPATFELRSLLRVPNRGPHTATRPLRVWEWPLHYESEGSEQRSLGAVSVSGEAWWSIALSAPGGDEPPGEALFVKLERHGPVPAGYRGGVEAEFSVPLGEIDALTTLLAGVVDQARRDGVLSDRPR